MAVEKGRKGERLMILGAGVMQGPAIRIAREMGLETVVVDGDPAAPQASRADRFECIDLKDKEGIEALARTLQVQGGLGGIMTAGTDFSATVAWVAERLGLPGIPYQAALNASDKERMRRRFKEGGVPSPEYIIMLSPPPVGEDAGFALPFPYPVVVKPVDNMGGRGCRRVDSDKELAAAVPEALGFSRSGRVIVEEFMAGPEFSVDAIVHKGELSICGFADRHIFFPPYFIEMGHTMPSSLGEEQTRALLEAFAAGVRALGITSGAAKGDLKLSPRGPMIGEIAARLSGGYMSGWTYPYASGVEPARGAILAALGKSPEGLEPRREWTSAERAFISIPGRVRSIQGLEKARAREHIKDLFLRIAPGSPVRFPENNVTKGGNVISAAPDREGAVLSAERAARAVLIRLEAPRQETEDFLCPPQALGEGRFPPDAFALPEHIRALLLLFPEPPIPPAPFPGNPAVSILPFPDFTESGLLDYTGRTVSESLDAVREITGLALPLEDIPPAPGAGEGAGVFLGRSFWAALIRGGYQGAAYVVDRLVQLLSGREEPGRP
ncbi:MAG: ATP-grasp domain-containing protein [Treponema sp.]|jgi:biotin carboxylase|nr:ATP-grasp domain-containing protein [Treponema sp.]